MARRSSSGMTLLEWLAVIALVAGFGAVLVAGARRAPMVDEARTLKNELEEIDRAIRAAENSGQKPSDGVWDPPEFLPLLREKFTRLRESGSDPFGNPYPPVPVGARPTVAPETLQSLQGQLDPSFWRPFGQPQPSPAVNPSPAESGPLPAVPPEAPAEPSSTPSESP
jgi:type II secretory pathway pseudopilin PulG